MKIAYLMLVHKNPHLQRRAIDVLSTEDCGFFIHVDRKSDIEQFSAVRRENVFFTKERVPVYWGEFSQVQAQMLLVRQALACSADFDWFVFSTGSDYPLRSGHYIHRFFEKNRGWEFMNMVKMPAPGYPLSKINKLRYPSTMPIRRFAVRLLAKLGLARRDYRKHLAGLEAYAGDGSWALSRVACEFLVEFATRNPHVEKYFRNVFTSDEMFFHTILGNSPLRSRVRKNLVYVDWRLAGNHPAVLTDEHVKFFEAQQEIWDEDEWGSGEVLFARKFSDDRLDLLDRIDEMIKRKEERGSSAFPSAASPSTSL
jgi:hypothetical protein